MVTDKSEGEVRLTIGDSGYTPQSVTPGNVTAFLQNIHISNQIQNLLVQVFPGPPDIWVEDVDGELDDDLTSWIKETAARVDLYASMRVSWYETIGYGCSVKSLGYTRRGGRYELTELRDLPAQTFGQYPGHGNVQNSLMPGIVIVGDETEVWQTYDTSMKTQRIRNYQIVREPTTPQPAGRAYALPCYPVVAAINHSNKAADQQVERIGSPIILPQIEGTITQDLKAWGDAFVKKWGRNTGFIIPPGITFPDVKIRESPAAKDRLDALISWIESYFNPTTVLKKTGDTIGGSDTQAGRIWAGFIGGTQSWIEQAYEAMLRPLLDRNGYEDRYIKIRLARPELDRSQERREQVRLGVEAKALTLEEIRDNLSELELSELSPGITAELRRQYPGPAASVFGNTVTPAEEEIMQRTEEYLTKYNDAASKAIRKIVEG